jgi:hypothetical protein
MPWYCDHDANRRANRRAKRHGKKSQVYLLRQTTYIPLPLLHTKNYPLPPPSSS